MTPQQFNCLKEICILQRKNGYCPSYEELTNALGLKSRSGIHRLVRILTDKGYIVRNPNHARSIKVNIPALPSVLRHFMDELTVSQNFGNYNFDDFNNANQPLTLQEGIKTSDNGLIGLTSNLNNPFPKVSTFSKKMKTNNFLNGKMLGELSSESNKIPFYGAIAAGTPFEALSEHSTVNVPSSLLSFGKHYALEARGDSMEGAGIYDGDTLVIRSDIIAREGHIVVALIDQTHVTLKYYYTQQKNNQTSIILKAANPHYNDLHLPVSKVVIQGRLVALLRVYT